MDGLWLWILRRPWRVLLASLVVAGTAAVGISRVRISHDTRIFFGEKNPDYGPFRAFEDTFGRSDNLVFALVPAAGTIYSREALEALTLLTDAAWGIPYARRVISLANFPFIHSDDDVLLSRRLFDDPGVLTEADLVEIERLALLEGAQEQRLVSASGHVAGVFVSLEMPTGGNGVEPEVAEAAHIAAQAIRDQFPGMDVRLTGSVMLAEAFGEASRQNLRTLVPLMFLVMVVVLWLALRSLIALGGAVLVILLAMVTGMGLAGWLDIPLTAVSVSGPGLIVTLAVADCVHLLRAMLHRMRDGLAKTEALVDSMRCNFRAVFLTSTTTAIGFFCLNFSESAPFRDLGNIVGMGVAAAFVFSIIFLPAYMVVLPTPRVPAGLSPQEHKRMARFGQWITQRPRRILAGILLFSGATLLGLPRIALDDVFIESFDHSFAVRRDTDFLIRSLGGADILEYTFDSGESGGIADPVYLSHLEQFSRWQSRQPNVVAVHTLADMLKRVHRAFRGLEEDRLPETREFAAQLLLLYELALPPELDLRVWVNMDRSATRVQVVYGRLSAQEVRAAARTTRAWLQAHIPPSLQVHETGLSLLWANITYRNIRSMLGGSLLALTLVSMLLGIPLRDARMGVLSLIPNLLPPIMALGIWGLLYGRIGLALSVVMAMTIGIVIDDTIHFLIQYQRARKVLQLDAERAIVHVFRTVGTALCTTTIALVAGFLILCLSPYRVSFDVGLLCAIILAVALLVDLLMLPSLLLLYDRDKPKPPSRTLFRAALQLARPINCLMSGLAILLGAWAVHRQLPWSTLAFGLACGALITAGGNTLNDYLDIEIDRRNHPQRPLPSGRIQPAVARMLAVCFFLAGILAGLAAHPVCGAIALLAVVLLLAYEMAGLKQAGLSGNLTIGFLTGLLFLAGGAVAGDVLVPASLAVLAFLSSAGREIIKDIEDIGGDATRNTWPMRVGVARARAGATILLSAAILLSPLPWFLGILRSSYLPFAGLSILLFLRAILILRKDSHAAGRTAKQAMAVVLIAFFVGVFL